jgi:hypothetical protein
MHSFAGSRTDSKPSSDPNPDVPQNGPWSKDRFAASKSTGMAVVSQETKS